MYGTTNECWLTKQRRWMWNPFRQMPIMRRWVWNLGSLRQHWSSICFSCCLGPPIRLSLLSVALASNSWSRRLSRCFPCWLVKQFHVLIPGYMQQVIPSIVWNWNDVYLGWAYVNDNQVPAQVVDRRVWPAWVAIPWLWACRTEATLTLFIQYDLYAISYVSVCIWYHVKMQWTTKSSKNIQNQKKLAFKRHRTPMYFLVYCTYY